MDAQYIVWLGPTYIVSKLTSNLPLRVICRPILTDHLRLQVRQSAEMMGKMARGEWPSAEVS